MGQFKAKIIIFFEIQNAVFAIIKKIATIHDSTPPQVLFIGFAHSTFGACYVISPRWRCRVQSLRTEVYWLIKFPTMLDTFQRQTHGATKSEEL